jgi:hypothetical protein
VARLVAAAKRVALIADGPGFLRRLAGGREYAAVAGDLAREGRLVRRVVSGKNVGETPGERRMGNRGARSRPLLFWAGVRHTPVKPDPSRA